MTTSRNGWGAPMPDDVRNLVRANQHPARAVTCPWCGAHDRKPCITKTAKRRLINPHPQRITAWARTVACCPQCQVEPGVSCHDDGRPRVTIHTRRYEEAEVTA